MIKILGDIAKDWSPPYPDTEYVKMKCNECGEEVMVPKDTIECYKRELKKRTALVVCPNHSIIARMGVI